MNKIRTFVGDDDLPNIYLLHGELSDEEVNELYNHPKVKAHVTSTKRSEQITETYMNLQTCTIQEQKIFQWVAIS